MRPLWTLQFYILREMGKTFLLTAIALTGVLGLGGGVLQVVKLGDVTPGQLGRLMLLVLPVAAALTLPIAALFSAAATYGRLAADNEFVACRSSGINLFVLFLPVVALSFVSAGVTFTFSNYVIPDMARNLETFLQSDFSSWIRQRLDRPRGLTFGGKYRISADDNAVDASHPDRIILRGIRFIEVDGEEWVRYGTAREVVVEFMPDAEYPKVRGVMSGLSIYDRNPPRFFEEATRVIPAQTIRQTVPLELKFLRLGELLHFWRRPGEWRSVLHEMERVRLSVGRCRLFTDLWSTWNQTGRLTLRDANREIVISGEQGALLPDVAGIELQGVTIEEHRNATVRHAQADRAVLEIQRGATLADSGVRIDTYDVRIGDGTDWVRKSRETFGPIALDRGLVSEVQALSDADLLGSQTAADCEAAVGRRRSQAADEYAETLRRIVATINERMALSVSVVFLVLLGAVLGIVFRGAHVMVAFGISFVPSLLVIVAILTGKQMSYNAPTHGLGLGILWGGILLAAALDYFALTRMLRR